MDQHEPWLSGKYVVLASQQKQPVAERRWELKVRSQGDCRPDRAWLVFLHLKDGKDARNSREKERMEDDRVLPSPLWEFSIRHSQKLFWKQKQGRKLHDASDHSQKFFGVNQSLALPLFGALGLCYAHFLSKALRSVNMELNQNKWEFESSVGATECWALGFDSRPRKIFLFSAASSPTRMSAALSLV
jgi:hypothetical protein